MNRHRVEGIVEERRGLGTFSSYEMLVAITIRFTIESMGEATFLDYLLCFPLCLVEPLVTAPEKKHQGRLVGTNIEECLDAFRILGRLLLC